MQSSSRLAQESRPLDIQPGSWFDPFSFVKDRIAQVSPATEGHSTRDGVQYTICTYITAGDNKIKGIIPLGMIPVESDTERIRERIRDARYKIMRFSAGSDMIKVIAIDPVHEAPDQSFVRVVGGDFLVLAAQPFVGEVVSMTPLVFYEMSTVLLTCTRVNNHSRSTIIPWQPITEYLHYVSLNYQVTVEVKARGGDAETPEITTETFLVHMGAVKGKKKKDITALQDACNKALALDPKISLGMITGLSIHFFFRSDHKYTTYPFLAGIDHVCWSPLIHTPYLGRVLMLKQVRIRNVTAVVHGAITSKGRLVQSVSQVLMDYLPTAEQPAKRVFSKSKSNPEEPGKARPTSMILI